MFKSSYYQDLSLSEWLAHTPPELVMAHLRIDKATYDAIPKEEFVVMPGYCGGFGMPQRIMISSLSPSLFRTMGAI